MDFEQGYKHTHRELCVIGARWLRNSCQQRCPVVFVEMVFSSGTGETPDVFGFAGNESILIEAKTSRSDFLADKKKFFRIYPEQGMGDFRYYLCPEGIIKPEDLPEKWGLIWVNEKGRCKVIKEILLGNCGNVGNENRFEKKEINEKSLMYSALRRITSVNPNYFIKY